MAAVTVRTVYKCDQCEREFDPDKSWNVRRCIVAVDEGGDFDACSVECALAIIERFLPTTETGE